MRSTKISKWLLCVFLCCLLILTAACGQQGNIAQQPTATATEASDSIIYQFSADIVKTAESIGVNTEWNDRFLVMVILDNDHSKSYTSGDEILYLDQMDLLAQKETFHSKIAFPGDSLSGRQITEESGDLIMLIGGKYALGGDTSPASERAGMVPMSCGMPESGNPLEVTLLNKDDVYKSATVIETDEPAFTSGSTELAGFPEAGSEIACSIPVSEGVNADELHLFLTQYDEKGAVLSCSTGTASASQIMASDVLKEQTSAVKAIVTDENLLPLTTAKVLSGAGGGIRL